MAFVLHQHQREDKEDKGGLGNHTCVFKTKEPHACSQWESLYNSVSTWERRLEEGGHYN